MLCNVCGKDVGETPGLCDACAAEKKKRDAELESEQESKQKTEQNSEPAPRSNPKAGPKSVPSSLEESIAEFEQTNSKQNLTTEADQPNELNDGLPHATYSVFKNPITIVLITTVFILLFVLLSLLVFKKPSTNSPEKIEHFEF